MIALAEKRDVLDVAYDRLRAVDTFLAKAIGMSEVARIARIETLLREYLNAKWTALQGKAAWSAAGMARAGRNAREITAQVRRIMQKWPGQVEARVRGDTAEMYRLARIAGWKSGNKQTTAPLTYSTEAYRPIVKARRITSELFPSFDLVDAGTATALSDHQVFWIGDHYDAHIGETIATGARETLVEAGVDRRKAGILMRERIARDLSRVRTPAGYIGSKEQYFELLAANAATTARSFGQLRSFVDLGITSYEVVNPTDARTCPVCGMMVGKVFNVSHGTAIMESEMAATDPAGVRVAHPWMGITQLRGIAVGPGPQGPADADALAKAGFAIPPYHGRCRCTIAAHFSPGGPRFGPDKVKPPKPKPRLKPRKKPKPKLKPKPGTPRIPKKPKKLVPQVPAHWPKMPKTRVTPKEPFSRDKLEAALKKEVMTVEDQAEVRRQLNALYADRKLHNFDLRTGGKARDAVKITPNKGWTERGSAFHAMDTGEINFRKSSWEDVQSFAKGRRNETSVNGVNLLVHEGLHGCSAIPSGGYYWNFGAALEELTNELASRRITRLAFRLTRKEIELVFSYDEIVEPMGMLVDDILRGWSHAARGSVKQAVVQGYESAAKAASTSLPLGKSRAVTDLLTDASLRFKRQTTVTKSIESAKDKFLKELVIPDEWMAGMTVEEKKIAVREFRKAFKARWEPLLKEGWDEI